MLGWAAEREGDLPSAFRWYCAGLRSMQATADFTASWCLRAEYSFSKFAAERLLAHRAVLPPEVENDELFSAIKDAGNSAELNDAIRGYWRSAGRVAERESRPLDAYHDYFCAGWDDLVFDYVEEFLECLEKNAAAAGSVALAKIARRHFEGLQ